MSGGNPRLGDMQDVVIGIPQIALVKDPETGDHYGVTHLPTYVQGPVRDPDSPTGQRMMQLKMRSRVIVEPDQVEIRRFNSGRACISCISYNWRAGQDALADKKNRRFKLAIYQQQSTMFPGVGPGDFAICDQKPTMLVGPAGSCEHYRAGKNGYSFFVSSGRRLKEAIGRASDYVFKADRDREEP